MKACRKCNIIKHRDEFYAKYATCKQCLKFERVNKKEEISKRNKEWRQKNPDYSNKWAKANRDAANNYHSNWRSKNRYYINKLKRNYYLKNKSKSLLRRQSPEARAIYSFNNKLWRYKNHDALVLKRRQWEKLNKDKIVAYSMTRRGRMSAARGMASSKQIQARIDFYGSLCYLCLEPYKDIDHVIPLSRGGTNWPANLRPICKSCNSKKGGRLLGEFLELLSAVAARHNAQRSNKKQSLS